MIRARRNARRLDGDTGICRRTFSRILGRCLPREGLAPFDSFPFEPALDIILFVHWAEGLTPGIYLLNRRPGRLEALRSASMNLTIARNRPLPDLPLDQVGAPSEAGNLRTFCAKSCC